jgi:putative nucleotidyltransferase with HDIG domain
MSAGESLLGGIKNLIDSGQLQLPVFNRVAFELQVMAASQDYKIDDVERLILGDQVLAAEVLKAANSAFFGGLSSIQTIRHAVVRLSLPQVLRLVLLASERNKYETAKDPDLRRLLSLLWRHTSVTAGAANWLARRLNYKEMEEEAFLGGLLHDVGKLVILRALDAMKTSKTAPGEFTAELIQEVLISAHTEVGYDLLKRWNVPEVYCRIARDHHLSTFDPTDIPHAIVRLANAATSKVSLSLNPDPTIVLGAMPESVALGAGEILLAELEILLEDQTSES